MHMIIITKNSISTPWKKFFKTSFKLEKESIHPTLSGKLFHTVTALYKKLRRPADEQHFGICNRFLFLVLRPCLSDLMIKLSLKYDGARSLRHLKAIASSLNLSICRNGSQANRFKAGVTWSYFLALVILRAAKFSRFVITGIPMVAQL